MRKFLIIVTVITAAFATSSAATAQQLQQMKCMVGNKQVPCPKAQVRTPPRQAINQNVQRRPNRAHIVPVVVLAGNNGYGRPSSAASQSMDPELQQLNDLLRRRALRLLGPMPEGIADEGYHGGSSKEHPCRPGYHPLVTRTDTGSHRTYVRCVTENSGQDED